MAKAHYEISVEIQFDHSFRVIADSKEEAEQLALFRANEVVPGCASFNANVNEVSLLELFSG